MLAAPASSSCLRSQRIQLTAHPAHSASNSQRIQIQLGFPRIGDSSYPTIIDRHIVSVILWPNGCVLLRVLF